METKTCTNCGETKPVTEFGADKRKRDGLTSWCKECKRREQRERYANNRDVLKARVQRIQAEDRRELEWYRKNYPQEGTPWNR